jgi:site-specific recombinase XerD
MAERKRDEMICGSSLERVKTMAEVFRGKVAIRGDQMEAYFEALEQFETDKQPMRQQLEQCARDFERTLARQYTAKTVRKHTAIIALFIDFVCWDTDVRQIEEITRGIANSYFRQWYRRKVGDRTESELKTAMKKFFEFLDREKGITNEAVLKSFQR